MKKKKSENSTKRNTENLTQWRKSFLLKKQRAAKERAKMTREQEAREVFEQKRAAAPESKSPVTSHTKGYYRFSRVFPSNIDENGFRENNPIDRKRRLRKNILVCILCVAVFFAAYVFAKTGLMISATPLDETTVQSATEENYALKAYHFTYDELREGDVRYMADTLKNNNCDTAVFEFKDDYGYVMFNTGSFTGASADRRISTAQATVDSLKNEGYGTAAYISCFKDTVAAQADLAFAVRANTAEGAVWLDNSSNGWLNPFSQSATEYLLNIVSAAADAGFDYILLNNTAFSEDSGNATAYYTGEAEVSQSRNATLKSFVNSAAARTKNAKLILMCAINAFDITGGDTKPGYYGNMIGTSAGSICADARVSLQTKNTVIGSKSFLNAADLPYVFVLTAGEFVRENYLAYSENTGALHNVLLCIERADYLTEELFAVKHSAADGYIIW